MAATKKTGIEPEPILEFVGSEPHLKEADGGVAPIRTCILERERKGKPDLLRFVLSPDGMVLPDIKGNLPGRGVWVTAKRKAVEEAVRRRSFQRAFRKQVLVDDRLPVRIEDLLKRSALERLSLANKAGSVVAGFAKVREAIEKGEILFLLHAWEAAADGREKLDRKFTAISAGKDHIAAKNSLSSAEICLATGGLNVIHAGLRESGASRAFLRAIERYDDYCAADPQPTAASG